MLGAQAWHVILLFLRALLQFEHLHGICGLLALVLAIVVIGLLDDIQELQRFCRGLEILVDALNAEIDELNGL